jgi:hypothetical protein
MRKLTLNCYGLASLVVTTALVIGCSAPSAGDDATSAHRSSLTTVTIDQFVVLANHSASFNDRSQVTGGDVGVAAGAANQPNVLTTGFDARIAIGEVLVAQSITLNDRTIVGDVEADRINAPHATTGARTAFVAPPAAPAVGTFTAGTTAVNVNAGQTVTLAAGRFGAITVNGALNLTGGLYEIQSLRLGSDAKLTALARATVRITGGLTAGDRAHIVPAAALHAAGLRFMIAGTVDSNNTAVNLGNDDQLTAVVVARGAFRAADRLVAAGAIAAQDVILGHDTKLTFDTGFGCATAAGCDDGNSCTVDACADAQCTNTPANNGASCNDGNACTSVDTCQAGVCHGANPVVCAGPDQCHTAGACNPATGVCSNPTVADGAPCDDHNACSQMDTCRAGVCTGGSPLVCSAGDECHAAGICDPATATCSNVNLADGTPCDDGNPNTLHDSCAGGVCQPGPLACSPGAACPASDQCHGPGVCDASGACVSPPLVDGSACDDGDPTTIADSCESGVCLGNMPKRTCGDGAKTCAPSDQCHDVGVCDASGACLNPPLPDGTPCNDGDSSSSADTCVGGVCQGN